MDDTQLFAFDSPLNQSSYIKVIGVGGGGNNAVNHMFRQGISGVDFIVSNTDKKALDGSPVPNKLVLGSEGLGVGGRPAKARKAAEEKEAQIKELFSHDTKMIFITAGMGGGTGTGAAPVIARFAKEIQLETEYDDDPGRILVVAVVTTPFQFEGNRRIQQALEGVEELRKYVDSILVINNEKLRTFGNLAMSEAFSMANNVLLTAVKGIAEIITLNAYVNIDFRDVNTVMENSGTALMGIGEGQGENRALQAIEQATTSVLLNDNDIAGAKDVLVYFSSGHDHEITMDEMGEITDFITDKTGSNATNVIWGTGYDDNLGDKVKITLIATGFEQKETPVSPTTRIDLPSEPTSSTPRIPTPAPAANEPQLVNVTTNKPASESETYASSNNANTSLPSSQQQTYSQQPQQVQHTESVQPAIPTPAPVQQPVQTSQVKKVNLYDQVDTKPTSSTNPSTMNDEGFTTRPSGTPNVHMVETPTVAPVMTMTQPVESITRTAPATKVPSVGRTDQEVTDRATRIRMVNDLLHNNPNGAQIIEAMRPSEITGEALYQAAHSSQSDATETIVSPDGTIKPNLGLYGLLD